MEKKRTYGNSVLRAVFVGFSLLMQVGWILLTVLVLNENYPWLEILTRILSLVVVLQINSKHTNAAYKMPWIMLIVSLPVMGLTLYLLIGIFGDLGSIGKRMKAARKEIRPCIASDGSAARHLARESGVAVGISRYLEQRLSSPVYDGTDCTYFGEAKDAFEAMKADLEKAKSFIFMEYFIVSGDSGFQEIADILARKANEGVDVRFMYDDAGSVGHVNLAFARRLSQEGIHCMVFNPVTPVLNLFMNHRDHRKITVIDGKVGYTGGFNLADEYFGRKITYGRWKDTGIRLEGDGVKSLTASFLEIWMACSREKTPVDSAYFPDYRVPGTGFVQPYEDDPMGQERVAETVYLNLIYAARKSLYVTTPYLIITDEMANALTVAAKRGVDVRIITPGVPDKRTIYAVTRSYYAGLASKGVRIFEYTPGFCHAKQVLCDGIVASIGTSNLDYRSLYLHFENNVLLCGGKAVEDMAREFENLFPQCREVTEKYRSGRSRALRLGQYILRLFAPML